jgi:MscS family membrane protein
VGEAQRKFTGPLTAALLALFVPLLRAQPSGSAKSTEDPLGRENPRSAVTAFLEACGTQDYQKASQYLDLHQVPARNREQRGPELAKQLEVILNSDKDLKFQRLSGRPEGNPADDPDPNRELVATIAQDSRQFTLDLEREALQTGGPQVWLFSTDTVAAIPQIHVTSTPSRIERYLPPVLVANEVLETPIWKWLALALLALLMVSLSRLLDWVIALILKLPERYFKRQWGLRWLRTIVAPVRVMVCLAVFRIGVEILDPSAIARLYIGRAMQIIFVWSVAWCMIRLVELFMNHVELSFDTPQQLASRTMLHLGRRTANVMIVVFAILIVLENWGYNTATLIAGLGVGGIAVALAAQQTIANIFGGVSLVGDSPIRIGEFGKFGDVLGVVEDIGMRSTRIRTLNRTIVSVPNSNFAGLNLENYSMRDKILFNPTFQIKRSVTEEQVHALMEALEKMFAGRRELEPVAPAARLTGLAAGYLSLEVFSYVRTADINEFYKIQGSLLLAINDIFKSQNIELFQA